MLSHFDHCSCGALFFSSSTADQRIALEDVELSGAQRGEEGRLILDGAIDHLVDERQLVFGAADLFLVPVIRVLRIGVGIALHEVGQHERSGAVAVLPVGGAGIRHFLGIDRGVVAPAEAIIPFGVERVEVEHDGIAVGGFDLVDIAEIAGLRLRALGEAVVAEDDVLGGQFARRHHAGLVREHDALAQADLDAQRILLPLPALGEFAADGVGRQVGVGIERILAAVLAWTSTGRRRTVARGNCRCRG